MSSYKEDYFLFAENVLPGENGKQTIVNIFREAYGPLPFIQGLLSIAAGITFTKKPAVGSTLDIGLRVTDPKGSILSDSVALTLKIEAEQRDGITLGITANGMPIEHYGDYKFEIIINNSVVATRYLKTKATSDA